MLNKTELFPLFLKLKNRKVVVVGGGKVASTKLDALLASGALVKVIAPEIKREVERSDVTIERRTFEPKDLDDVWLVVAAATPSVNRQVAEAAEKRKIFVNAVDDPDNANCYLGGVVRHGGVTLAISTDGEAPAIAGLLREGLESILPEMELEAWMTEAIQQRKSWRKNGIPMEKRRPLLLKALIKRYENLEVGTEKL